MDERMATILDLIANRILAANPVSFIPAFVPKPASDAHHESYTNPKGEYSCSIAEMGSGSTFEYAYWQHWASNTGIMMKYYRTDKENQIDGGDGSDVILGGRGADAIIGGGGDDIIVGGGGNDYLYGQFGSNVLLLGYELSNNGGTYFLDTWQSMLAGKSGAALLPYFIDKGAGTQGTATGGTGADIILAGSGKDEITGLSGNDMIFGGGGDDLIVGDAYDGILGWDGTNTGHDYIDAGAGNDVVMGNSGDDTIFGQDGDDLLWGDTDPTKHTGVVDTGNDTIYGGTGNDTIHGGAGDDIIYGDNATDVSSATQTYNDTIYGDAGNDGIMGGLGNDNIYGGTGNDFYFFQGTFGTDNIYEYANEGTDDRIVFNDLTINQVVYGRLGNDLMFGNAGQTNTIAIKDWFVNFGIDSIWFTTGIANQYNYVTAQALADAFGVVIPSSGTATGNAAAMPAADVMEGISGSDLTSVAVAVSGVDLTPDAMLALC